MAHCLQCTYPWSLISISSDSHQEPANMASKYWQRATRIHLENHHQTKNISTDHTQLQRPECTWKVTTKLKTLAHIMHSCRDQSQCDGAPKLDATYQKIWLSTNTATFWGTCHISDIKEVSSCCNTSANVHTNILSVPVQMHVCTNILSIPVQMYAPTFSQYQCKCMYTQTFSQYQWKCIHKHSLNTSANAYTNILLEGRNAGDNQAMITLNERTGHCQSVKLFQRNCWGNF